MRKLKKSLICIIITCLIVGNLQTHYVFADGDSNEKNNQCSACSSTPASMQLFINFEVELLGILQGANAKAEIFGTNKSTGLFAGGGLTITNAFLKSTLSKAQQSADSELKAARAAGIASILLSKMAITGLKDSKYSIQILYKNEAFVRDYKTLQEIDMSINDIMRDMGVSGIWNDRVSASIQKQIQNLQYKYAGTDGNSSIFQIFSISSDVKYKTLLSFILKLNSEMKSILLNSNDYDTVQRAISDIEDEYSKGDIVIIINQKQIELISRDYGCVSSNACNKSLKEAIKSLKKNIKEYGKMFSNAKKTINDANNNLKEAFSSNGNNDKDEKKEGTGGLTDRQVELLYIAYGIDAYKLTTSQLETLKQNFEQMEKNMKPVMEAVEDGKTVGKAIGETVATTAKGVVSLVKYGIQKLRSKSSNQEQEYINGLSESGKNQLLDQLNWQKNIPSEENETFAESMQNVVNEILMEKGEDKEIILVGVNQDTHYFVEIGRVIHSIVSDEIGEKDTDGLVKTLGEICTYQCANHGVQHCYSN